MSKLLRIFGRSIAMVTATLALAAQPTDFTVESPADGSKFRLAEAKGKYVALHFLLKTECPVCLRHTRDYTKKSAALPGVVQVLLKPDSAEEISKWSANLGGDTVKGVTIYRDTDAALAKKFGIPDGYEFHGEVVHFPALVLLDPAGHEVFRYVGKNNSDRYSFDSLVAKISELERSASKAAAR